MFHSHIEDIEHRCDDKDCQERKHEPSLISFMVDVDGGHHDEGVELEVISNIEHPIETSLILPWTHILDEEKDCPPVVLERVEDVVVYDLHELWA